MAVSGRREGEVLAEISNAMVRLHTESYGKGPTHAKTYAINDLVVCLLHGCLTKMERTLLDANREDVVRQARQSFYDALASRFRAVVEEATGRKVIAYLTQLHLDPDFVAETFLLEPATAENFMALHEQSAAEEAQHGDQPE